MDSSQFKSSRVSVETAHFFHFGSLALPPLAMADLPKREEPFARQRNSVRFFLYLLRAPPEGCAMLQSIQCAAAALGPRALQG
ncbi:hypothetical protein XH93_30010 [Bradyrhizobium sp. CCBAU 51753]|nr:hypothetical protein XH93_30010 [Bradyrhizobium sp. CCBAU 51753]